MANHCAKVSKTFDPLESGDGDVDHVVVVVAVAVVVVVDDDRDTYLLLKHPMV